MLTALIHVRIFITSILILSKLLQFSQIFIRIFHIDSEVYFVYRFSTATALMLINNYYNNNSISILYNDIQSLAIFLKIQRI